MAIFHSFEGVQALIGFGALPNEPVKHESVKQRGLFFWAEPVGDESGSWMVVSQAEGYPGTEAWDDWFAYQKDADDIAQMLAKGEL
jgi:hypothetical protein